MFVTHSLKHEHLVTTNIRLCSDYSVDKYCQVGRLHHVTFVHMMSRDMQVFLTELGAVKHTYTSYDTDVIHALPSQAPLRSKIKSNPGFTATYICYTNKNTSPLSQ